MASNTSAQPALSWSIVGHGAIGLLAASRLQLAGYKPGLWLRQPAPVNIQFQQQPLQFLPAVPPLSAVLVPVKSYAVLEAVTTLLPHLTSDAQLVLSHNGMGNIEQVLPLLAPQQGLWFLTTTHGALKQAQSILHTGLGQSVLAPLNRAAQAHSGAVSAAMDCALGPVALTEDIQPFLWQKLAINAVINPLTALHNCHNGELAQPQYQQHISAILHEVCQVAAAAGYALHYEVTLERIHAVIQSTAANFSSMQQDIVHQRRTEIEAINGYIVAQAARFKLAVPHNAQLLHLLLQLQQGYGR
ncbi:ketopantoate reductase family protein [Rheinheimera sp.]|uniref:ketopantoate reductase family protein n=1 Tax=Rheinheimera sp. TaxID=1869214 RepID=UPI00273675DE|nr:2-dehydropantoate 2-reductase [Rheinheimera sp.]MDP2713914.1 2-dehydropantoate 2-reductase [Rheinheimera sp.]